MTERALPLTVLKPANINPALYDHSLSLRFDNEQFDPRITFTRNSVATRTNKNGLLESVAVNAPRLDFDPISKKCIGLLIEDSRTNSFTYSEEFNNVIWQKAELTVVSNARTSPDGTLTADKLVANTVNTQHSVAQAISGTAGVRYVISIYAEAGEYPELLIAVASGIFGANQAIYNLTTGAISGVTGCTASMEYVGNNIWRCVWSSVATATTSGNVHLYLRNGSATFVGDGTSGIYVWGAQVESGPACFINTGTATGTTTAVILSGGVSTDGAYTGMQLDIGGVKRYITAYVGATKTATVAALASVPGGAAYNVFAYAAYPTSYIKTVAATVTRAADLAEMTGANFSSWYNHTEGTFVLGTELITFNPIPRFPLYIDKTGQQPRHQIALNSSAHTMSYATVNDANAVVQAGLGTIDIHSNISRVSFAYKNSDFAYSARGNTAITSAGTLGGAVPLTLDRLRLGMAALNGHITMLVYYPKRLSNAYLALLSNSYLGDPDKVAASLQLNFNSLPLDPRIKFTRASTATYFDANGVLQTALSNVPRIDYNPVTRVCLGLLIEEARTNLLLNSASLTTQSITTTAATRTLSFYGTGTVVLSGTHSATVVGLGVYPARKTYTYTPTAGTLTLTVTGTVQYANDELGSFATSYIPTTGASATRTADSAIIFGTNFSSWYNQSEGSFIAGFIPQSNALRQIISVNDFTSNESIQLRYASGSQLQYQITDGGTLLSNIAPSGYSTLGSKYTAAYGYKTNNAVQAISGVITGTDTSVTLPTVNRADIGSHMGAEVFCGHISNITYYPARLSNTTLEALSK